MHFAFMTVLLFAAAVQQSADDYYSSGMDKLRGKDYDGAIRDFTKAIELDPKSAAVYHNRGLAKKSKGDLDGGIADYTKAIELDPKNALAYNNRGNAKKSKGDLDGAIADYTKAIEIDPKSAAAYRSRGHFHYDRGSRTDALADFRKACEIGPANQDYIRFRIWLIRARLGERGAATEELEEYLKTRKVEGWPENIAQFLTGRLSEADFLNSAESKYADTDREQKCEAWFYAGTLRLINGDQARAEEYLQKCLDTGVKNFVEYASAAAELKTLEKGK